MSTHDRLITDSHNRRSSIISGSLWMIAISVVLFFVPLINGLVGGFVGGYKVGGAGRALVAAILPAAVVAVVLFGAPRVRAHRR